MKNVWRWTKRWRRLALIVLAVAWMMTILGRYLFLWEFFQGQRYFSLIHTFDWVGEIDWEAMGSASAGPGLIFAALAVHAQFKELKAMRSDLRQSRKMHNEAQEQTKAISEFNRESIQQAKRNLEEQKNIALAEFLNRVFTQAQEEMATVISREKEIAREAYEMRRQGKADTEANAHIRGGGVVGRKYPTYVEARMGTAGDINRRDFSSLNLAERVMLACSEAIQQEVKTISDNARWVLRSSAHLSTLYGGESETKINDCINTLTGSLNERMRPICEEIRSWALGIH